MKFKSFLAFLFSLTLMTSSQEAAWASDVGGWALVDPSTGEVMSVHVCDPSVCGPNGSFTTSQSTMNELSKNAGCSVTCVYVPQSTADQNGNVAGYSTSGKDQNPNTPIVTYDFAREIFKIESNIPQASTNSQTQEFGFQDLTNTDGRFILSPGSTPSISSGSTSISSGSTSISSGSTSISSGSTSISSGSTSTSIEAVALKKSDNFSIIQERISDIDSSYLLSNHIDRVSRSLNGKITNKKTYILNQIENFETNLISTTPSVCKVINLSSGSQKVDFRRNGTCNLSLQVSELNGTTFNLDMVSSIKLKK